MPRLPSFQFYPADWMSDPELRRCSLAARGVWMDMLCLMHFCQQRGVLWSDGMAWSDEEIASAISATAADAVRSALAELLGKGVAHRREDGSIYSPRMVADEAERQAKISAGQKGGVAKAKQNLNSASRLLGPPELANGVAKRGSSTTTTTSSSDIESADSGGSAKSEGLWPEEFTQAVLADAYMVAQRVPTANRDRIACCKAAFLVHSKSLPGVWLDGCLGECEHASPRNHHAWLFAKFVERAAEFGIPNLAAVWKEIKIPSNIWRAIPITKGKDDCHGAKAG